MSTYLDDIYDASADIKQTAQKLDAMASASYTMGNLVLGGRLDAMCRRLIASANKVEGAASKEIVRRLKVQQEDSIKTVKTLLSRNTDGEEQR